MPVLSLMGQSMDICGFSVLHCLYGWKPPYSIDLSEAHQTLLHNVWYIKQTKNKCLFAFWLNRASSFWDMTKWIKDKHIIKTFIYYIRSSSKQCWRILTHESNQVTGHNIDQQVSVLVHVYEHASFKSNYMLGIWPLILNYMQ